MFFKGRNDTACAVELCGWRILSRARVTKASGCPATCPVPPCSPATQGQRSQMPSAHALSHQARVNTSAWASQLASSHTQLLAANSGSGVREFILWVFSIPIRIQPSSVAQSCLTLCDPWTAVCQAFLSITNSQSLLKLMSTELGMPSNHLILCRPLFLPLAIFPSTRVVSNESVLCLRWPKY